MCSLSTFPSPPPEGFVSLCEQNAQIIACIKSEVPQSPLVTSNNYPDIDISREAHFPSLARDIEAKAAFLQHQETPRKRLFNAWYEHGFTGVLEELAASNCNNQDKGPQWLASMASTLLAAIRWSSSLHSSLFPHLSLSCDELMKEFSSNPHWTEGFVRAFAWHPHATKFAFALRDDSVRVHSARKGDIVPTLRHKLQKGVISLAWKFNSASVLAVGCKSCVLLWDVDPTSLATRPSSSSVQVLSYTSHSPITSLSWSPVTDLLATGCPTDSSTMIWDPSIGNCERLRRVGGGGTSFLSFSPDGSKLLTVCPSSVMRVWETQSWTCEKWTKLSGRCQAACWSPDGHTLLFSTAEEPIIYCLTFDRTHPTDVTKPVIGGSKVAIAVADLTQTAMETEDSSVIVGGLIQSMCWDPTGERLAVSFKGAGKELIAVFQTCLHPTIQLIPCGFIRGSPSSLPTIISFQPKFSDGALLTVVWSGGKISYIPLYFVTREKVDMFSLYQRHSNEHWQSPTLYSQ